MRVEKADLVSEAARAFHEKGYVAIELLSPSEAARYRDAIFDLRDRTGGDPLDAAWDLAHGISRTPELWSLIDHPRILPPVRDVLRTCEVVYAEHSALQVRRSCAASEWRRDSIGEGSPAGGGRQNDYRIVRVACYLECGDDLTWGAVDGSHRPVRKTSPRGRTLLRRAQAEPTWAPVRPGTCVLFNPRLTHAVGPTWETSITALLAFGANNPRTERYRTLFGCPDNPYKLALSGYLTERGLA